MSDNKIWDEHFEDIVRTMVPFFQPEDELTPDTDLQNYGLDSFGVIELLVALEGGYGIHFCDEVMTRATFATPATLWDAVTSLREPAA
ncbi:acyl carrier protein [Nakamurella sp. UYEF19]|uniref:phosphopantetheine-binding protein n=1 Tax=Nakamurella sp. UYEF19 TaxID=1756392 RepID=UPI0033970C1B